MKTVNKTVEKSIDIIIYAAAFFICWALLTAWTVVVLRFHPNQSFQLTVNTVICLSVFIVVFIIQRRQKIIAEDIDRKLSEVIQTINKYEQNGNDYERIEENNPIQNSENVQQTNETIINKTTINKQTTNGEK